MGPRNTDPKLLYTEEPTIYHHQTWPVLTVPACAGEFTSDRQKNLRELQAPWFYAL